MASRPSAVQTPLNVVRGKTAFVTGGSSGIGLGIARTLSAAGMKVAFTYLSEKHRDQALASFPEGNPGVHAIRLDTTDRDAMPRAADEVEARFGNVHLLVNNAGVGVTAQLSTVQWPDWDWAMAVNVSGVFSGVHTFLPRMLAHGEGGHLVATSSSAGLLAGSLGVYATTKFAVMGMFESLRAELDGRNIGVSVFCPGLVRSEIIDSGRNRQAAFGGKVKSAPPKLNPGAPQVDIMASAMDPDEAGRNVLAGVRRNDLFILSHPEFLPAVKERSAVIAASFSKKPAPAARVAVTKLFTPVIYAAEAAKLRGAVLRRAKPARSPARSK